MLEPIRAVLELAAAGATVNIFSKEWATVAKLKALGLLNTKSRPPNEYTLSITLDGDTLLSALAGNKDAQRFTALRRLMAFHNGVFLVPDEDEGAPEGGWLVAVPTEAICYGRYAAGADPRAAVDAAITRMKAEAVSPAMAEAYITPEDLETPPPPPAGCQRCDELLRDVRLGDATSYLLADEVRTLRHERGRPVGSTEGIVFEAMKEAHEILGANSEGKSPRAEVAYALAPNATCGHCHARVNLQPFRAGHVREWLCEDCGTLFNRGHFNRKTGEFKRPDMPEAGK